MSNRELKLVAEAKEKEFDRLIKLSLSKMSDIEVGLNVNSNKRHRDDNRVYVWLPRYPEIVGLSNTLMELRESELTSQEKEALK